MGPQRDTQLFSQLPHLWSIRLTLRLHILTPAGNFPMAPTGNIPTVYNEGGDVRQDPFLSHAKFATPMGKISPEAELNKDPFMLTSVKGTYKEPEQHLYAVNSDPFLTHSKGVQDAARS